MCIASSLIISQLIPADAATISLDILFSDGSTSPDYQGIKPWLKINTIDTGLNQVTMELQVTNLTEPEFVKEWYLNVNDSLNLSAISFAASSRVGEFLDPAIFQSTNTYKADGDGKYDILLSFSEGNSDNETGGQNDRFTSGDILTYTVTYNGPAGAFNSSSFDYLSQSSESSYGPFTSAAKINATGADNEGSAWIAAISSGQLPEPTTAIYALLATGLFLGVSRRRK